jgi:hypothetical protein
MGDVVDDAIEELLATAPDDPIEQRGRQLDVVRRVQDAGIAVGTLAAGGGVALAGPTMAVHGSG